MPRGPRLDAPGVLHHVMARGIERRPLFRTDADRDDFVGRLAGLTEAGACTVYAWALLPNHFHLLVRTAQRPLARTMRSLLTGYAGAFNRRHRRRGGGLNSKGVGLCGVSADGLQSGSCDRGGSVILPTNASWGVVSLSSVYAGNSK